MDLDKPLRIVIIIAVLMIAGSVVYYYLIYLPQSEEIIELAERPEYIYSKDFHPNKITLYGIKIGDGEDEISPSLMETGKDSAGWINMKNDIGYRIADG